MGGQGHGGELAVLVEWEVEHGLDERLEERELEVQELGLREGERELAELGGAVETRGL